MTKPASTAAQRALEALDKLGTEEFDSKEDMEAVQVSAIAAEFAPLVNAAETIAHALELDGNKVYSAELRSALRSIKGE